MKKEIIIAFFILALVIVCFPFDLIADNIQKYIIRVQNSSGTTLGYAHTLKGAASLSAGVATFTGSGGTGEVTATGINGVSVTGNNLKFKNANISDNSGTTEISSVFTIKEAGSTKSTSTDTIDFNTGLTVTMVGGKAVIDSTASASITNDYINVNHISYNRISSTDLTSYPKSSDEIALYFSKENNKLSMMNYSKKIYTFMPYYWKKITSTTSSIFVDSISGSYYFTGLTAVNSGNLSTYSNNAIKCDNTNIQRGVYKIFPGKGDSEAIFSMKWTSGTAGRMYAGIASAYNFTLNSLIAGLRFQDNARVFHYVDTSGTNQNSTDTTGHTLNTVYYYRITITSYNSTTATASFWESTSQHAYGDGSAWGTSTYTATIKANQTNWYMVYGLTNDSTNGGVECSNAKTGVTY